MVATVPEELESERTTREVMEDGEGRRFFERLRSAGRVFRVQYHGPGGAEYPGPMVWLAPGEGVFRVIDEILHVNLLVDPTIQSVSSRGDRRKFEEIERQAAEVEDRDHAKSLVDGEPSLKPFVEALGSAGIPCRRCRSTITGIRSLQPDEAGVFWILCIACLDRVVEDRPLPSVCWHCGRPVPEAEAPPDPFDGPNPPGRYRLNPRAEGCPGCGF